jgi:succinoglycan biosynthesis protein ExoA
MTPSPSVSLVVPCRNEARWIQRCLRSILAQEIAQGDFEIIVADGDSEDGTQQILYEMAENDGRIRVIENPERIVSTGLNAAIRVARGRVILRMDAHTEYAPDYVQQCVETLNRTGADNVGGPWVARGDGWVGRAIAAAFQSPFAAGGARGHDATFEGEVDTVYLGCWPKDTFEKFGYFDEELVRNQDDEHNLRITRGGGRIWQTPKIRSWYRPRGSFRALFAQYMQYGYWKVRVIQKHKLPASWRHLVPGAFLLALCLLALGSFRFPFALWVFCGLLSLYAASLLGTSTASAWSTEWKLFPILPLAFCCYHFGYGSGFLLGIWDFGIGRGQKRRKGLERVTRA